MKINKFFSLMLAVLVGVILVPGISKAAFGVSPPSIVNENLKPNSSFVYVIILNTNTPVQDMRVESEITGDPEIVEWLSIKDQESFIMPKGKEQVPMNVNVRVPKGANVGKYKGNINLRIVPVISNDGNVSIRLGGNISVELNVIDYDITDYFIKSTSVNPSIEGQPISLNISIKNLGNTTLKEVMTEIEVTNAETNEVIGRGSGKKLSGQIYPHTIEEVQVSVPVPDLPVGHYWANAKVFKDGEVVYKNRLYLRVNEVPLNNVVETSVRVGDKEELKAASPPVVDNVRLETSVTVKAPMTNKLIGVVIGLLIVLILVTANIYRNTKRKGRR